MPCNQYRNFYYDDTVVQSHSDDYDEAPHTLKKSLYIDTEASSTRGWCFLKATHLLFVSTDLCTIILDYTGISLAINMIKLWYDSNRLCTKCCHEYIERIKFSHISGIFSVRLPYFLCCSCNASLIFGIRVGYSSNSLYMRWFVFPNPVLYKILRNLRVREAYVMYFWVRNRINISRKTQDISENKWDSLLVWRQTMRWLFPYF